MDTQLELLLWIGLVVLAVFLVLAQLKLFSIDRSLKDLVRAQQEPRGQTESRAREGRRAEGVGSGKRWVAAVALVFVFGLILFAILAAT